MNPSFLHPFHIEAQQETQVQEAISAYPGVSVASLMDAHPGLPADVIWALLVKQSLFTDLSAASLMNWDQVFLYRSEIEVKAATEESRAHPQASLLASRFLWDGRLWEAEVQGTMVVLRPEIGAVFSLRYEHFQRLVDLGEVKPGGPATPSPLAEATRQILVAAGPKALEAANRRWRGI